MAILTKEAFLNRVSVKPVELSNKDTVYLRSLPASYFVRDDGDEDDDGRFDFATLITKTLCGEDGELFFAAGGRNEVKNIPLADFSLLGNAIMEMNGLKAAVAGEMPVPEKNSEGQAVQ